MWIRETPGWEAVKCALSAIADNEDADSSDIRRKIFVAVLKRLSDLSQGEQSSL
jgi:hypothetical protein